MRIQVMGARGMLGQAVVKEAAAQGIEVVGNPALDIRLVAAENIAAEVVVNCAGLVKQRQDQAHLFRSINGYAVHRLARACDEAGARLIQISTDCVFDYVTGGPFTELAYTSARDLYGLSKIIGEVNWFPHLVLRTSFVGRGERGLLHDLMTSAEMRASTRLLWTGHTTTWVARAILALAETQVTGLLHLPGEEQTRLQLVTALQEHFGTTCRIIEMDEPVLDRRLASVRFDQILPAFHFPTFREELLDL